MQSHLENTHCLHSHATGAAPSSHGSQTRSVRSSLPLTSSPLARATTHVTAPVCPASVASTRQKRCASPIASPVASARGGAQIFNVLSQLPLTKRPFGITAAHATSSVCVPKGALRATAQWSGEITFFSCFFSFSFSIF